MVKKAMVYDSQKGFSRFLKYQFKGEYSFDVYRNFKKFDDILKNYHVIIFVVNADDEIGDLMRIYKKGVPVIVCNVNNTAKTKLAEIENLVIFDTNSIKSEMAFQFKSYLTKISTEVYFKRRNQGLYKMHQSSKPFQAQV